MMTWKIYISPLLLIFTCIAFFCAHFSAIVIFTLFDTLLQIFKMSQVRRVIIQIYNSTLSYILCILMILWHQVSFVTKTLACEHFIIYAFIGSKSVKKVVFELTLQDLKFEAVM